MFIKGELNMNYQAPPKNQRSFLKLFQLKATSIPTSIALGLVTLLAVTSNPVLRPVAAEQSADGSIAQISANANVIQVNPTSGRDEPGAGSTATPYRTISYALSQAPSGTLIQLANGAYTSETGETFPLRIPSGVIVRGYEGSKGQTVMISGSGSYVSPTFARQNVTIRMDENSALRGVAVTNPASRGTAVWVESTNPTIANNTFVNSLREGVFVSGNGTPKIEGNIFKQNSANGISVAKAAQPDIRNNLIENTGFGIAVSGKSAPLIVANRIVRNKDGIVVSESATPVLRGNIIEGNERDGLVAISDALPDLGTSSSRGENTIQKNGRHDLYNATRSNVIPAYGNQVDAKRVQGSVNLVVASDIDTPPVISQPPTSQPPTQPGGLSDIQNHWARSYISSLSQQGIIKGFPDGTFRPNAPVTRVQFAAIINQAFRPAARRSPLNFADVETGYWGYQPIQTAYQGGFLAGYPDGSFVPNQEIPRVQVLVSLANGLGLTADNESVLNAYQDLDRIPTWAVPSVAAATQKEIVVNYPTPSVLNPNRQATRAEVAAFVYQALVQAGKAQAIDSPYLVRKP